MQLVNVHVTNYRSIEDSGPVPVGQVTCLVGMNESGKTTFLQALYRFNPSQTNESYDGIRDYPSKYVARFKRSTDPKDQVVVKARFRLEPDDYDILTRELGSQALQSLEFSVTRGYNGGSIYSVPLNEDEVLNHLRSKIGSSINLGPVHDLTSFRKALGEHTYAREVVELITFMDSWRGNRVALYVIDTYLSPRLPEFIYFDDYSVLPGQVELKSLRQRAEINQLTPGETGLLRLLGSSGLTVADLLNDDDYENHQRQMEGAASAISEEVFAFWSQNKDDLGVELTVSHLDATQREQYKSEPDYQTNSRRTLNIRVRNYRHRVSVPFSERSKGFVWFFSFLAYFSELERQGKQIILLLDEPGLNLHASAQADFLRFIDERLAPQHQVLYTTHSPFLIDPSQLSRVRTVVDIKGRGTVISDQVLRADAGTTFPLQAALGYEIAQTLFVGPDVILLEGPSDLVYLDILSEALRLAGRPALDARWVKVPVGGADKLSTFVALLGANKLNVVVLLDASTVGASAVTRLRQTGVLSAGALITIGDIVGQANADIEDLFEPDFYASLVTGSYGLNEPISLASLPSGDRIVRRINSYFASTLNLGRFNHFRPAAYLLREQTVLLPRLSPETIERAGQLITRINQRLSPDH